MKKIFILYLFSLITSLTFGQEPINKWDYNELANTKIKEGAVTFMNTSRIDDLLNKRKRLNTNKIKVFRIQLYSGGRDTSSEIRNKFQRAYPNVIAETSYEQPYFKTKVGVFKSRLVAEKKLHLYKSTFPEAYIFQELISIDKLK